MKRYLLKLTVGKKIKTVMNIIIAVFSFAVVMSVIGSTISSKQFKMFYNESYISSITQLEMRKDLQYAGKHMLWSVSVSDPVQIEQHMGMVATAIANIETNIDVLKNVYHNDYQLRKLDDLWEDFMTMHNQLIGYVDTGDKLTGIMLYVGEYENVVNELQTLLDEIGVEAEAAATKEYNVSRNTTMASVIFLFMTITASIVITVLSVRILIELIKTPVEEIKGVAEQLTQGNLDVEIKYESQDEFGDLANSFRKTCSILKSIITDLSYVLEELKNGNFNVNSKDETLYVGAFEKIISDVKATAENQSITLDNINQVVNQVSTGADQLAHGAQDIAEGATEQANSIKVLSETIESITQISVESTDRAIDTVNNVKNAVAAAEQGRTEAAELINAMKRITDTSKEIENIIADIEDIASQTNLLSLNASIEAARAGEAGRGFAVVADQIGKLASDSARSAIKTRDLISKSLEEIQSGSQIVENTTSIMAKTIEDMEHFEVTASNMAKAFQTQTDMIKEVETNVEQISSVVENNSATAEETSAVSEELSAQSVSLSELTNQFTFRK